jgi:hypothetical protein
MQIKTHPLPSPFTGIKDASTKRPLPVLILPFKTSLNDFIPDNHEFQDKTTLV